MAKYGDLILCGNDFLCLTGEVTGQPVQKPTGYESSSSPQKSSGSPCAV